jgi:hypothetical protein
VANHAQPRSARPGAAVATWLLESPSAAITALSLAAFAESSLACFLLQRFASTLERPEFVLDKPSVLPVLQFVAFVLCILSLLSFAGVLWAPLPILIWFGLGFLCCEMAIRRFMRRSRRNGESADRKLAIFAVNEAQGRNRMLGTSRYPFP